MLPSKETIIKDVLTALTEDIGKGDVSAYLLPQDLRVRAAIKNRDPMLVCGQVWANYAFKEIDIDIKIDWQVKEGDWVAEPQTICIIEGNAAKILTAERTALNFLQTLSGTATTTYQYLQKIKSYKTILLDTRKTIPGLRLAQKYAVRCAGATNHRLGLYDAILIKENHIKACGSIAAAIAKAKQAKIFVEIEVENLAELKEALQAQPDRIMLDNFNMEMIKEAISINTPKKCPFEVSGNINLDNIAAIAKLGVDYISVGALTKSVNAIDLSLRITDYL